MKKLFNTIMPLVCLVALFGCATNPVTGRAQLMLVSEQQEITMGKQAAPSLNWGFGGGLRCDNTGTPFLPGE
jgi:hypothetical protein